MKTFYLTVIDAFIKKHNTVHENDLNLLLKNLQYDFKSFEKDFIEKDYIVKDKDEYHLNYRDGFLMSLRKSHDILCFESLPSNLRTEVKLIIDGLLNKYRSNIQSVFLIGSAARNQTRESSDIDLLIICKDKFHYNIKNTYKKFQLIIYSIDEFKTKYEENSELLIWSFDAGLLLYDANFLNKYYKYENTKISNKTILHKRQMIKKIMDKFSSSKMYFENLDVKVLSQLVFHMARYILMLNNILPLSKAEILDQLNEIDSEQYQLFTKIIDGINHDEINLEMYGKYYYMLSKSFKQYLNTDYR